MPELHLLNTKHIELSTFKPALTKGADRKKNDHLIPHTDGIETPSKVIRLLERKAVCYRRSGLTQHLPRSTLALIFRQPLKPCFPDLVKLPSIFLATATARHILTPRVLINSIA
jgi:hypothetical protein